MSNEKDKTPPDSTGADKPSAKSQDSGGIKRTVTTRDSSGNEVQAEVYVDPDGNVIDPPVIPSFEQRLQDAHARADDDDIADLTAEYNDARDEQVQKLHRRAAERRERERAA